MISCQLGGNVFYCFCNAIFLQNAMAEDADNPSFYSYIKDTLTQTWRLPNTELYIPINTWQNRNYSSKEDIDDFNERPWA